MGLDEYACSDFLDFIYTGKDVVNTDNADILLHVAHMTQIKSLHDACKEFLKTHANKSNCARVWQISHNHADTSDLAELSRSLILKHFAEIAQSEEKLDILGNVESLTRILESDNINVVDKSGLFCRVAFSWVTADFDNRYQYFSTLCDALITNGVPINDILEEARDIEEFHKTTEIMETLERVRLQQNPENAETTFHTPTDDVVVVIGGSEGGNNCNMMCFSFPQKIWFALKPLPLDPGFHFALCTTGLDLYVSGGSGPGPSANWRSGGGSTFLQFCGESNEWVPLPNMPQKRQYHIMYAIDNFVYVLGGKEDNTCTNIVYKYDCDQSVWHSSKTHLFEAVRSPAHACIKKKIYLLGGFCKDNKQCSTVQCFNCEYDQSYRIRYSVPDFARLNSRALNFNGRLLLIHKNGVILEYSEKNPTREVETMKDFDRKGFGTCCFEDKILIFGGEVSFIARKDMLLCDVQRDLIHPMCMQETMPVSLSNFCFTKALVLRDHLITECGTSMSTI